MNRRMQPSAPPAPRSSASVMAMLRDPRVLHVYPDYVCFKPVPTAKVAIALTVVVTVDDTKQFADSLRSLIMQDYQNFRIVVVCMSPKNHAKVEGLLGRYQRFLPPIQLFSLKSAGWPADALNGALPLIQTEYWSWLHAADIIHPKTLSIVANAILEDEADYYSTHRYDMQVNNIARPTPMTVPTSDRLFWAGIEFPYDRLITYRMSAIVRVGGFVSYDRYPGDTAWIAAYKMKAAGCRFRHIPLAVYFARMEKANKSDVSPIEYRRALLLQHWPSFYVEETDEEAVAQLLDSTEEEEERGAKATD